MQTLTISLDNRMYQSFERITQELGKTPEEMTAQWIAVTVEQLKHSWTNLSAESALEELPENDDQAEGTMPDNPDPLLALAGTLKYEATDLSERHDEYIGKALLAEMRGDNDE
jgi:hypothetical protein